MHPRELVRILGHQIGPQQTVKPVKCSISCKGHIHDIKFDSVFVCVHLVSAVVELDAAPLVASVPPEAISRYIPIALFEYC